MLNFFRNGPTEAQKIKANAITKKYANMAVYLEPDDAKRKKINAFIKKILEDKEILQLLGSTTKLKDKIEVLKVFMPKDLDLNDSQLYSLIAATTRVIPNIEAILAHQHHKQLNPNLKLALQTSMCLAATYLTPELFALYTSTQALAAFLKPHLGIYEDLSERIAIQGLSLTLMGLSIADKTFSARLSRILTPTFITSLPWYVRFPLMIYALNKFKPIAECLLQNAYEPIKQAGQLATRPDVTENARDFFDIMYGQADDATLEKHQGCLATKSMGDLGKDCAKGLRFLWNSLPTFYARGQKVEKIENVVQANSLKPAI